MGKVTRNSAGLVTFQTALAEMEELTTRVGWFESARYPDGTQVAYVAAIQEFGAASQGIPPRPFMRPTIVEKQREWEALMARFSTEAVKGQRTAFEVMDLLGLVAAGDVRHTISELQDPPLSPLTIAVRATLMGDGRSGISGAGELGQIAKHMKNISTASVSTKPLVFSSIMLGTLTSVTTRKSA